MPASPYKCLACGRLRPSAELLAYWPIGEPLRRKFVCRPTLGQQPCFRELVGSRTEHELGPA